MRRFEKYRQKLAPIGVTVILLTLVASITPLTRLKVCAAGTENNSDTLESYDFQEIDESLQKLFPEEKLDFKEIVSAIISGDMTLTGELLNRLIGEQVAYAFSGCKENLVHILLLAVVAAVFTNFSNVFHGKQMAEVSFYIVYLLLIALCLNSFQLVIDWTTEGIYRLTAFMTAFCPIYFLGVVIAKGSATAAAFYNLALFIIYFVELFIGKILIPLVHLFLMVKVLNFLSPEDYLSKFAELMETLVNWMLKTLLACIIGLNVVQGLIHPAIDTIKQSTVTRSAEAIPGIGDAIGGMTEVVIATAVLTKNGIGLAGALICFLICLVPLIQAALLSLMYALAAAVIQPISDKRVVGCVESVAQGCHMMIRIIFTMGMLFLLTIVIVSAVSGG